MLDTTKITVIALFFFNSLSAQERFVRVLGDFNSMLKDERTMSFKEAVFSVENVYLDGTLDRSTFESNVEVLKKLTYAAQINYPIQYAQKDSTTIKIYAALFKLFSDTVGVRIEGEDYYHFQFEYDFNDIFGTNDWRQSFVSKLMETNTGNCHSLPYLYKILCDEFKVPCHLALAPNHVYIKHRSKKGGWYNTELTSGAFPMDAWLMASGYISLQAVQNGIYLDTLSEKESIALCVLDLAQGFNHKYPDNDGKFVIECCDLALKHFPDYVNAILLKAETRLKQLQFMQKEMKYAYLKQVTAMPEGKAKWDEMNSLYMQLYKFGYRQMPEQMYVEWLTSLKTEKKKYSNKNAPGAAKD
jgi:hypothetical protein